MEKRLLVILLLFSLVLGHTNAQNTHFWDGIEAFDGPTDTNPILASQNDFYFDKMVAPIPDTIYLEINRLVERTSNNTDLRDFILWHLLHRFHQPEYMSQDQVFVYLSDQYFSRLEIRDLNETNRALIQDKAERLRRLALFNVAPEIKINDSIDLQAFDNNYTVLFFYDHDCGLCYQEMHDLDSVHALFSEISVLAIDMNSDDKKVLSLYETYDIETTPLIYVLDRDKRIIAKKIRARQIPMVL